jgi:hypothetical protein
MQPSRSPSASANLVRVTLLTFPVLLIFAATVLPLALLLTRVPGASTVLTDNLTLAVLCGLVVWLFLAIFHIRTETLRLPVPDRRIFLRRLVPLLEDLGYDVTPQGTTGLVSRPGFRSLLLGGSVQVQVEGDTARVVGPKVFVELLRRRLRMQSYMDRAQQPARDGRHRPTERLLKRVELSVRLTGGPGAAVYDEILQALAGEGAEVVCDLHILAQSETGIRETVVEELRDALGKRGLTPEIRKDFPQWEITAASSDPRAGASPASA